MLQSKDRKIKTKFRKDSNWFQAGRKQYHQRWIYRNHFQNILLIYLWRTSPENVHFKKLWVGYLTSSLPTPVPDSLTDLLRLTYKERPKRPVTFQTLDQSDEIRPGQKIPTDHLFYLPVDEYFPSNGSWIHWRQICNKVWLDNTPPTSWEISRPFWWAMSRENPPASLGCWEKQQPACQLNFLAASIIERVRKVAA